MDLKTRNVEAETMARKAKLNMLKVPIRNMHLKGAQKNDIIEKVNEIIDFINEFKKTLKN